MKAVKIAIVLMMVGLLSGDVVADYGQKKGASAKSAAATKTVRPAARTRTGVTKPTPARARRAAAATPAKKQVTTTPAKKGTPARGVQQVGKKPAELDVNVWDSMSQEEQSRFTTLNTDFKKTIATLEASKNYKFWRAKIINQAKAILAINILLLDYCREIIADELNEYATDKNLTAQVEIDSIDQDLQDYIDTLKTYIPKDVLSTGSERDQFNSLMSNMVFDRAGNPTSQWTSAVEKRAKKLVLSGTLKMKDLKESLTEAFNDAVDEGLSSLKSSAIKQFVNDMVTRINEYVDKVKTESSPEFINQRYQDLMLNLGDSKNWNMGKNMPSDYWKDEIVIASKGMMKFFGMSLEELEHQIGAQVFFVAAINSRTLPLGAQKEADINILVTGLKNRIANE